MALYSSDGKLFWRLRDQKGSAKVTLRVDETMAVPFALEAFKRGNHGALGCYVVAPGEVEICLAGSSRSGAKTRIMLTES